MRLRTANKRHKRAVVRRLITEKPTAFVEGIIRREHTKLPLRLDDASKERLLSALLAGLEAKWSLSGGEWQITAEVNTTPPDQQKVSWT